MSYADQRYGASQHVVISGDPAANTSLYSADSEVNRMTFMSAVEILDFSVKMTTGATYTSVAPQIIKIGKSLAGTGTIADLGTSILHTAADDAILNGTMTTSGYNAGTANHVAAGDDLVVEYAAGTATATAKPQILEIAIEYRERFTVADSE